MKRLGRCQHRGDRHTVALPFGHQFIAGAVGEHRTDQRAQFAEGLSPRGQGVETRILELLGFPEPGPQSVPLPRGHDADPDETVLAPEDRVEIS